MKYVIMLGDGMADFPVDELNGMTPLMAANKPNIDYLANHGVCGMMQTVPEGQSAGSDNTNLSIMGYDPLKYYTGRSPLEAASMGVVLNPEDVAYRCNLVTLSDEPDIYQTTMVDYSSDEITTEESTQLINFLAEHLNTEKVQLYPGVSYRHCLVIRNANTGAELKPPHDISGKPVKIHLPKGENKDIIMNIMQKSRELLKDHPVNKSRIERGLRPATCCWMWGEGRKPSLPNFEELHHMKGAVISAVDLLKGIAICAGMDSIDVPGATGNIDTNFDGKAAAAIEALKDHDFVYIHVEAPDECGHRGEAQNKVRAIELIDEKIVGPVFKYLQESGETFAFAVTPDHRTPMRIKTHSKDPVPFVIYKSDRLKEGVPSYNEYYAMKTGVFIPQGCMFLAFMQQKYM